MRISDWSSDVCSSDLSLLIVDAEHFEAPAQSDCPVNPVQHHIFIAHIEGGDGFRSIRIDDEERRQLTLFGKAHYRELSVVRHFGGLDGGRSLHDVVGRSEEHTSELQSLMRISYAVFC